MQGPQTPAAIVASPQRLAVNGQYRLLHTHRLRGRGTQRRQPHRKAGLKGIWPQGDQNSPEDIFLGNPMRKIQQFQQDVSLQLGPCSNGRWSIGSSKHGHDRNHNNTLQRMQPVHRRPRIFQLLEMPDDFFQIHPHNILHIQSHNACHRSYSITHAQKLNTALLYRIPPYSATLSILPRLRRVALALRASIRAGNRKHSFSRPLPNPPRLRYWLAAQSGWTGTAVGSEAETSLGTCWKRNIFRRG